MTKDTKVKHTNGSTIFNDSQNGKYLQKLLKCQARRLWCRDLAAKLKGGGAQALLRGESTLIKVENVFRSVYS